MKKITWLLLLVFCSFGYYAKAQETESIKENLTSLGDVVTGINERLTTSESDLSKLTKIKISGYIQTQYQYFESPAIQPTNLFSIRRARLKVTYEMIDGVKFVIQPDLIPGGLSIKDAYVVINDRWTKAFSITAGKFNRPNYEVEYSSSQREVIERSSVIRAIYPGERAIGAKLEFNPLEIPVHFQLALLNGSESLTINDYKGTNLNSNENKDFDNYKDLMGRLTYNLQLGNFGGLDFGLHGYYGTLKSNTLKTLSSDYATLTDINIGDPLKRSWIGAEFQLFADVLGGMSVKGEYITGQNASVGFAPVAETSSSAAVAGTPNFTNNFSGYYLYLIKNIGKKNQFAFRYDYYDPNTDLTGTEIRVKNFSSNDATIASKKSGKSDLAVSTYSLALHHYFDDNIRITLNYDIVQNETVGVTDGVGNLTEDYTKADGTKVAKGLDYSNVVNQNVLTLRIQAKF